jgi:phosphatidylinositol 4-kinase
MRVLEQHPVDVTFFFVPQVVQALRTDKSGMALKGIALMVGYVERFIFETSKISQLFCHQIIWNMKANTCRGDDGVSISSE